MAGKKNVSQRILLYGCIVLNSFVFGDRAKNWEPFKLFFMIIVSFVHIVLAYLYLKGLI